MKLKFLFAVMLACTRVSSYAQASNPNATPITPLSPNAASLGKYGDIPMNLYAGQMTFSVPIYDILLNDFKLPISLSYAANGNKVDEHPGWVGMGWTLMAPACISRQVRGLEDESDRGYFGYYHSGQLTTSYLNNQLSGINLHNYLDDVAHHRIDSEPDLFTISGPGLSGKFFFDDTQILASPKHPVIVPQQKIDIAADIDLTYIYNSKRGLIKNFTVKDLQGAIYYFDVWEAPQGEPGDPDYANFVSTWYLSKIVTPHGHEITFTYANRSIALPPVISETRSFPIATDPSFPSSGEWNRNVFYNKTNEVVLKQITFPGGKVVFTEGAERTDWNFSNPKGGGKPRSLADIQVFDADDVLVKKLNFIYGYANRLQLQRIEEVSGTMQPKVYSFDYYEGLGVRALGDTYNYAQDYWGYFNGRQNSTLIPSIYWEVTNTSTWQSSFAHFNGADRNVDFVGVLGGQLRTITYPTGGTTTLTYESNEYLFDKMAPQNDNPGYNPCGNLTDLATVTSPSGTSSYTFEITSGSCVELNYIVEARCLDGEAYVKLTKAGGEDFLYKRVKFLQSTTGFMAYTERMSIPSGTYTAIAWASTENVNGCTDAYGRYNNATLTVRTPSNSGVSAARFMNNAAGGLRVAKVVSCPDETIAGCVTKKYKYYDPSDTTLTSGRLAAVPILAARLQAVVGTVNWAGDPVSIQLPYYYLSSASKSPLTTTGGNFVGYRYVTELDGPHGENGKTVHRFVSTDEEADLRRDYFPFGPETSSEWKRGVPLETWVYSGPTDGNKLLRYTQSQYQTLSALNYFKLVGVRPNQYVMGTIASNTVEDQFQFTAYDVVSGFNYKSSEVTHDYSYAGGSQLDFSTSQTFQYGTNHLLLKRIDSENSKGEAVVVTNSYPDDAGEITGLSTSEAAFINAIPDRTTLIETKTQNNGSLTNTTRTLYSPFHGVSLPSKVLQASGSNALREFTVFHEYDDMANLVSYSRNSKDVKTSYIWGYHKLLPIAEAVNATQSQIFHTSFEDTGTLDANAKTGDKSYNGDYTFTPALDFTPAANSVLTFWYWQNGTWTFKSQAYSGGSVTLSDGSKIDEVRICPATARMTTFTHHQEIGVTSKTDSNNLTTYYEYDDLRSLRVVRDDKRSIVQNYEYKTKR